MDLSDLRQEYADRHLDLDHTEENPYRQFERWYKEAESAELLEPNAMVLGTIDSKQRSCQRTVLLKSFDERGFVFYTNYGSRKASHIEANPHVSLLFQWLPLQRQVEMNGIAEKVDPEETAKYFRSRPRGSQIGAWVSRQSQVVSSRSVLDEKLKELEQRFGDGDIPVPDFWGGYRVRPEHFEFWQGRPSRLHDRIGYQSFSDSSSGIAWKRIRRSP
ncbi:MAG: pyridoxamine 5'-phosphate oxidase [Planctomycetota bacterium]|nr:pyridoxamine 5'-phosphate oxidase [Planctomycetota bacterium]